MVSYICRRRTYALVGALLAYWPLKPSRPATSTALRRGLFGADERRQRLVDDWVARFTTVTGQSLDARSFYDDSLSLSSKTTFEAVTHALMTMLLTDALGQQFGDGLTLIERVDSIKGEVSGTPSDRQFRIYVRLVRDARAMMGRSREFRRRMDNSIYHKGYPLNYREQRGTPSIQVSIALDDLHADVDVDYRASTFPLGLFNGHLSAANSDVRAGDNAERHAGQWSGFQNWWRNAFGVRLESVPDASEAPAFVLPKVPRAGKQDIKEMVPTFCGRGWWRVTSWRRWGMSRNGRTRASRRICTIPTLRPRSCAGSDPRQSESRA